MVEEEEGRYDYERRNGGSDGKRKRYTQTHAEHRHSQRRHDPRDEKQRQSLPFQQTSPRHRDDRPPSSSSRSRREKPMNEIIISPNNNSQSLAANRRARQRREGQQQRIIDKELERNRLLAEYGRLYGRRCAVFERKARLEYELCAIRSFVASVGGARAAGVRNVGAGIGANALMRNCGGGGVMRHDGHGGSVFPVATATMDPGRIERMDGSNGGGNSNLRINNRSVADAMMC